MRCVYINRYGSRDVLIRGEMPKPSPGEAEVLVRVKSAGVNPVDWKIREGRLKDRLPNVFPIVLGWDMAGVVEECGYGARRFNPGDEVYAYCRRPVIQKGTYCEYIALPESYLALKPENFTFEKAAAVPLAALTAYQGIVDRAQLKASEHILIVGASGGVGGFAVQFARMIGARISAIASRKNHAYLKELGAEETLSYADEDYSELFIKRNRRKADVVFVAAGGESLSRAYACVKKGGRCVTIVETGDKQAAEQGGFHLLYHFVEANVRQLDLFRTWAETGNLKVTISKIYSLDEADRAHEQIETGHTCGKIVLKI